MTESTLERRREKRLNYHWPVWFAEDFTDMLSKGQMVDVSSGGAAFTCFANESPYQGQYITTRFSVPRYEPDNSFNLENHVRSGFVCRVENVNAHMKKIAIQFAQPLLFRPGEQANTKQLQPETVEI